MQIEKKHIKFHLFFVIGAIGLEVISDYLYKTPSHLLFQEFPLPSLTSPVYFYYIILNLLFFIIYMINYAIVCPKFLAKKKIFYFGLSIIGMILIFAGLRYFLEEILLYSISGRHNYYDSSRRFFYYIFDNSYFAIKAVLYSSLVYLFFEFLNNKNKVHLLEIEQKKAELNFLKSQIEPHFLFNTLNTFYSDLIDEQPEVASDIHRLSELLRSVTYETSSDFISLDSEFKFLEDYIYFYKKRFEPYFFFDFQITGDIEKQLIPSLVLIHFVENIFKHGLINDKKNPAELNIEITETHLNVKTKNQVSLSQKYSNKGIGKENLERRLQAIYGKDYILEHSLDDLVYKTKLTLPFQV